MKKLVAVRPSPAMAVALVSLFVALGGSATAAVLVTGAQIKDGTVRSADIANGSLLGTDVANSSIRSADVADGSLTGQDVLNGSLTAADFDGPVGFQETLPSGATIRGVYAYSGYNPSVGGPGGNAETAISFVYRLPGTPTFHPLTHWLEPGTTTAACPGVDNDGLPQAAPGNACLYSENTFAQGNVGTHTAQWGRNGIQLAVTGATPGNFLGRGLWAVTAP